MDFSLKLLDWASVFVFNIELSYVSFVFPIFVSADTGVIPPSSAQLVAFSSVCLICSFRPASVGDQCVPWKQSSVQY